MAVGWAVFRNYVGHAKEIKGDVTDYPRFFLMPSTSHVESDNVGNNNISLLVDEHIDYEVEMVVRLGDNLEPVEMCIGCDTTNRTRQTLAKEKGWPWLEGKSFRGSGVLGTWAPWDPRIMEIGLSLNGETKQLATTDLMVHSFDSIMGHLTDWYGLSPGDLIWTGTPEGVGAMKVGDRVDAWMKNPDGEKISVLSAECVL
ncbi:MAG TPA: FAA hydrolase family protein [Candidatus Poseidoniales archaeon]|jgi:2-keto-4-pentenoate hydratase/2-oxohepta-3-ene-1,7-dioic acid hydratase in catechol pathway|nr:MAG TPA: FAA hydrolase family protein [Candidatus Poseidoniales archaeon]DAC40082.1 MAG TPA: FAA hydrolase family protein [Candidatus Poseidoniales archaeon]HII26126.1 fumarylacetoacetate hydrolase family protein [Candidatus Thalassarchaeaceae archaeon]HII29173.1 fumarylacetoacetate hydrolase family protein [Candidatus Thalassarchaeaceae archaeon]|tara:strand:+ start:1231 stop:1830 length:600 start_codon:yes stop_codon:yes gene_type:complete